MDDLSFVAAIVKCLAWPAVVVYVLRVFQDPIADLIPRLKQFKYDKLELDFGNRLQETAEAAAALPKSGSANFAPMFVSAHLTGVAQSTPTAAVLEAWAAVEQAAREAAGRAGLKITAARAQSAQQLILSLEAGKVIDSAQMVVLRDLLSLRNTAAQSPGLELPPAASAQYVHLASQLIDSLGGAGTPV